MPEIVSSYHLIYLLSHSITLRRQTCNILYSQAFLIVQEELCWPLSNTLSVFFKRFALKLNPPCGPGLAVSLNHLGSLMGVSRQVCVEGHIKGATGFPVALNVGHNFPYILWSEHFSRHLIDRHQIDTIPAGCSAEWLALRPSTGYPDGNTRRLHRLRQKGNVMKLVMLAFKTEWFSAPQAIQNLKPFIQFFCPYLEVIRFAKGGEIQRLKAQTGPEDEPSV